MMMDPTVENDGTAFICPECSFSGSSLLALMSHLNESHSEETGKKSIAPSKFASATGSIEKRSRRKPAFSHQIVSQASRQSPTLNKQQSNSATEIEPNDFWARIATSNGHEARSSLVSDENTNINQISKALTDANSTTKRSPHVLHSILSHQRPIAPKNDSPGFNKMFGNSPSSVVPFISSSPIDESSSFYSSSNSPVQSFRKNFRCRLCRLTYKNFHDCTAHIRKKHEIGHVQAGRYVEKLDTDVPLPPSATGQYKIRVKAKSLPGQSDASSTASHTSLTALAIDESKKQYQCKSCSFTSPWFKDLTEHQRKAHSNHSPAHLAKDESIEMDSYEETPDHEAMAEFLIDPVRAFGEVIEPIENSNGQNYDHESASQDGEMLLPDDDEDEDEVEALWKYQQEINDISETDSVLPNADQSQQNLAQRFKKFQCPHCEHSAPTLTKLKLHVATHINIKPFMCSICGWRANIRWYIQCHAKKRHPNANFEVLQLSQEEAEQTIDAYMKERGLETKTNGGLDSKRRYQCSWCQFRSNHPKFLEQHIATNHPTKSLSQLINHKQTAVATKSHSLSPSTNGHETTTYSKFLIQPLSMKSHQAEHKGENKSPALYNRSSLIQSDGTIVLPDPSSIVYPNFSSHANFNPNRLFYCALCYRGYRWRYDVKRHHKTMHETPEDEAAMGLSMSPKSIKRRNKEFNRNFRYLEYVPQLDGLISASMSSAHHSTTSKNDRSMPAEATDEEDLIESHADLQLNATDTRTLDATEDEAAALLMIESEKSDHSSFVVPDHHNEDGVIVFDEDREKSNKEKSPSISFDLNKSNSNTRTSSGFKPYRCPYCFYRTNWRTDSLRHIRARHKIEPTQDGYYELSPEEAERTYAEYERTFGFVVSKKVLGRYTNFCQMEWKDLQRSIWENIKDKPGYEQIIIDRLRPDNCPASSSTSPKPLVAPKAVSVPPPPPPPPLLPLAQPVPPKLNHVKPKRIFACMDCAFQSTKLAELDKHQCGWNDKNRIGEVHGRLFVTLYNCSVCSYRTIDRTYAQQHVQLHRLENQRFYYCSFCGYNHLRRLNVSRHIALNHPRENVSMRTKIGRNIPSADFSIRQVRLRRSFVERHLKDQNCNRACLFFCSECPQTSTSIFEHEHHRSCHKKEHSTGIHRCEKCSFGSPSLLYLQQHSLLHSKGARQLASNFEMRNVRRLPILTIFKASLGKHRRSRCRFCANFSSNQSSAVLEHIQTHHLGNSSQSEENLLIGSEMAREILALGEKVDYQQSRMDTN